MAATPRTALAGRPRAVVAAVITVVVALLGVVLPALPASAAPGAFTITGEAKNEGTSGTPTNFVFTVSVEQPFVGQATYTVNDGTAKRGEDFTFADANGGLPGDGSLVFGPGQTSQTITVPVTADGFAEPNETFSVTVAPAPPGSCVTCTATSTIINDDGPARVVSVAFVPPANEGTGSGPETPGTATFAISIDQLPPAGQTVTVGYDTNSGTATEGTDFTNTTGAVTFTSSSAGTTANVNVPLLNDPNDEPDETFTLDLAPLNANCTTCAATATILDNDGLPALTIGNTTVTEGNSGTTTATLTVTLAPASGKTVVVDYATAPGTATAGADYATKAGSLTFAPGETTKQVTVSVVGDTVDEANEAFTVGLSNATNATIGDGTGDVTITDDDGAPALSINDVTKAEGKSGTSNAVFTVTLTPASGQAVTVNYATSDNGATAPSDYTATSGPLSFAPGELTKQISVPIVGDTLNETDEAFTVTLSGAVNATISDATGTGTITNDDALPTVSAADVTVAETATTMDFTLQLSAASGRDVTVHYATSDGPAPAATAGNDYTGIPDTSVTFTAGQTTKTVTVALSPDAVDEPDEHLTLTLSSPTNATVPDPTAVGTITDDDAGPVFTINDAFVTETDGPGATLVFTVTKTGPTSSTITVPYSTIDVTAVAGEDYTAAAPGASVTFNDTDLTQTITIPVTGDDIAEADETMLVRLGTPSSGTTPPPGPEEGVGTIQDDEANAPVVTITDATVTEGTGGTANLVFTVNLTNSPKRGAVTVDYTTVDGTATAGIDYTAQSSSLTIPANLDSGTITIPVTTDNADEPNETMQVVISRPRNAVAGAKMTGTGTINDDDNPPTVSVAPTSVNEATGASADLVFTVTLSNPSSSTITVDYATADGTAIADRDYTAVSGTLTFTAGSTSATVSVPVTGDAIDEENETVLFDLSAPSGATISGADPQTGTINDDDTAPSLSVADVTVAERDAGTAGTTPAAFDLVLSAASERSIQVTVATADGTAVAPGDYTAIGATVITFAPGETLKTVSVTVKGEVVAEDDETFELDLTSPSHVSVPDPTAIATIVDDDTPPTLAVNDVTVTEGNSGTVTATFTATLSEASSSAVTVNYATANGTAEAPGDYTAASGTLTFVASDTSEQFTVTVKGDALDEVNETFTVTLSSPTNATLGDGTGVGTITDDDGAPSLSIADAATTEGNSATVAVVFTVTLSTVSGKSVSVGYSTADGTATAGADYTGASGTLIFAAGETVKTITVPVPGDATDEANETFTVTLANATNATISRATATGTINDDDEPAAAKPAVPQGYSLVGEDGALYAFGTAKNLGDMRGTKLNAPIIGVAYTPGGNGYWLVARDGGIFTFGDAEFVGSMGDQKINSPVIGMAATPTGKGYWLFAGDGGIFTFGDAAFFGSMGDQKLNAPIINMEPLASGRGYWLVAADGGIFTFGLGEFYGSMGDQKLNQPVFDMTSTDSDNGYWLVARDGGIFSFGDAGPKFFGSAVNETPRPTRVIGMDATPDSQGYWIADASGRVYRYGNAESLGDRAANANAAAFVAFAAVPSLKTGA